MRELDTSGMVELYEFVRGASTNWSPGPIAWGGLDAFTQGYIEAMAADWSRVVSADPRTAARQPPFHWGFSDVAPETLAAILKDCGAHEVAYPLQARDPRRHNRGVNFWRNRQAGMWANSGWPPLKPYLGDDGRVYLS